MNSPFVLAVVGSRSFVDRALAFRVLDSVRSKVSEVVSGGARGADTLGAAWARARGIPVRVFRPDWERFGLKAGFRRNGEIVAVASAMVAFWDGRSRGTADAIRQAQAKGLRVHVVRFGPTSAAPVPAKAKRAAPSPAPLRRDSPVFNLDDREPLTVEEIALDRGERDEYLTYREQRAIEDGTDHITRWWIENDRPPKSAIVLRGPDYGPPKDRETGRRVERRNGGEMPAAKRWAVNAEVAAVFPASKTGAQLVRLADGRRVVLAPGQRFAQAAPSGFRHFLRVKGWTIEKPANDGRGTVLLVGRYAQVCDCWVPRVRPAAEAVARVAA